MSIFKSKFLSGVMMAAVMFVGVAAFAGTAKADCSITMTLKSGMTNSEVMCLQQTLNAKGFHVDGSSAGSAGKETTHFGPATLLAVKGFQATSGLTADGVFGPLSRAALMGATVVVSPNTPAGGNCPNGMTLASNCTLAPNAQAAALCPNGNLLSNNCAAAVVAPSTVAGCVAGALFSSVTGASCGTTTVVSTGEGSLAVTFSATPSDNLAINKGEAKNLVAWDLKATGSDMKVTRLWIDLTTGAAITPRVWLAADTATLMDGSTVVATLALSASTVTEVSAGSDYQLQFNGLSFVVPVGTTKTLTLSLHRPTLTTYSTGTMLIAAGGFSFRAVDASGISNTYPISNLVGRTLNFGVGTALTGSLTASLNSNSPSLQSVSNITATSGATTAVKLMDFDLVAKDGTVNVTAIAGTLTTASGNVCLIAACVATVELRDGTNVLSSKTGAGTFTFDNLTVAVPVGTKTLSVWANVNAIGYGVTAGDGVTAAINATITATSGDSFATVTPATAAVTGNTQYLFQYAPTFAFVSASTAPDVEATSPSETGVNYVLTFSVTAPSGSAIYVNTASMAVGSGNYPPAKTSPSVGGTMVASAPVPTINGTPITTAGSTLTYPNWSIIPQGQTANFTVRALIPHGGVAGFTDINMSNGIQWNNADSASGKVLQTWGLANLRTATTTSISL